MTWTAVNDRNAIERARVIVSFGEPLTNKARHNILQHFRSISSGNPNVQLVKVDGFNLNFTPEGAESKALETWNVNWQDDNGNRVSTLTIEQPHLTYETITYFRWGTFIDNAISRLDTAVRIAEQTADVTATFLEYWDRFVFDGEPDDAKSEKIIKDEVLTVLPLANSLQNKDWHVSRGWTREYEGKNYLISQMLQPQKSKKTNNKSLSLYSRVGIQESGNIDWRAATEKLHSLSKGVFMDTITAYAWSLVGQKG